MATTSQHLVSGYNWIVVNPNLLGGAPTVKGTRISVAQVLELLAAGMTTEELVQDYPGFPKDCIHDVLKFAAHQVGKLGTDSAA